MRKLLAMMAMVLMGNMAYLGSGMADELVTYDMVGTNPGENQGGYKGVVNLENQGQRVVITWTLSGNDKVTGTGIVTGNTMAVAFPSGKGYGVGLYVRDPTTEQVSGIWTLSGRSENGTETWTLRH